MESLLRDLGDSVDIPPGHKARTHPVSVQTLKEQLNIVKRIRDGDLSVSESPEKKRPTTAKEVKAMIDEAEAMKDKNAKERASEVCRFNEKCFRNHPEHFRQYKHPHRKCN